MERMTRKAANGKYTPVFESVAATVTDYHKCVDRLGQIEDILGDTYDLDRLREAIDKKNEYERFIKQWEQMAEIAGAVKKVGAERVAKLVEADRSGRCVLLPCKGWLDLVFGEQEAFWAVDDDYDDEKIREITVRNEERFTWFDGWKTVVFNGTDENGLDYEFSPEDVGKTVFLTREAAEAALAKEADHE